MKVWLVTTGDGYDGNEWNVLHIWSTEEIANEQGPTGKKRQDWLLRIKHEF